MVVREMREDEAAAVALLWNENVEVHDGLLGDHLSQASMGRIEENLRRTPTNADAACFVAEDHGDLVGFVTLAMDSHPVMPGQAGEIEELYARDDEPDVFRSLVDAAFKWLLGRGAGAIRTFVPTDDPWTAQRREFWRSVGWSEVQVVFAMIRIS